MMNVFNEEPIQRNLKKTTSWPVKLAMKYGAKSERLANMIVIVISAILLLVAILLYKQLFFSRSGPQFNVEELSPSTRQTLERVKSGELDLNRLLPSEKEELERMGIKLE